MKEYSPHIVVVWSRESNEVAAVKEFSYKEDAEEKYNDLVLLHAAKIVLAKLVRSHGEG